VPIAAPMVKHDIGALGFSRGKNTAAMAGEHFREIRILQYQRHHTTSEWDHDQSASRSLHHCDPGLGSFLAFCCHTEMHQQIFPEMEQQHC